MVKTKPLNFAILVLAIIGVFLIAGCTEEETPSPAVQTCSAQGGDICSADELCEGAWLKASDTDRCCSVSCTAPTPEEAYPVSHEVKFKGKVQTDPIWRAEPHRYSYVEVVPYEILEDKSSLLTVGETYKVLVRENKEVRQGYDVEVYAVAWFGVGPFKLLGTIDPNKELNPQFHIRVLEEKGAEKKPVSDVSPPVISSVTINGQAVRSFDTVYDSVVIAGKVTDDVSPTEELGLKMPITYENGTGIPALAADLAADGSFNETVSLAPGLNTITLTASDKAGNEAEVELYVAYTISVYFTVSGAMEGSTGLSIVSSGEDIIPSAFQDSTLNEMDVRINDVSVTTIPDVSLRLNGQTEFSGDFVYRDRLEIDGIPPLARGDVIRIIFKPTNQVLFKTTVAF